MTPGKNIVLISAFIVIIAAPAILQMGFELGRGESPQCAELFLRKPTEVNLRSFEKSLEDASWFAQKLRPVMQYIRFILLKDAGDKAIAGREGWMFYKPGVRYLVEANNAKSKIQHGEPVAAIVSFRDQLNAMGIRLLVMPAPGKASIYPEMLTSRAGGTGIKAGTHTNKVLKDLKNAGIEVVDLFEVFSDYRTSHAYSDTLPLYLPHDTHWSPEGMRTAARAVAGKISDLGWVSKGTVEYELKPVDILRHGDVYRMIRVPQIERQILPDRIQCTRVFRRDNDEIYKDDMNSEVLVLGDSFLRIYERDEPGSGGFIAHLARELQFPLTSIVNDGGASTLVRQELRRRPEMLKNKKVVIWEFVERDIRFGTEGWKEVKIKES